MNAREHWPDVARQWQQVGPPLRPSREDIVFFERALADSSKDRTRVRPLILGVTPEIHALPWPADTRVLAADHTPAMIGAVWPGAPEDVVCAEWTALPHAEASIDLAFCDGGLHLLSHPDGQRAVARELARVLGAGGLCVLRLFVPPEPREAPALVLNDLLAGRVSSLNVLKLRLLMALQEDATAGVELGAAWRALTDAAPDFETLAARIGWSISHLLAINTYRDSAIRYHFVTLERALELFTRESAFDLHALERPCYELGERCPTLVLRRRR